MPKIPQYDIEESIHQNIKNPERESTLTAKKNLCSTTKNYTFSEIKKGKTKQKKKSRRK